MKILIASGNSMERKYMEMLMKKEGKKYKNQKVKNQDKKKDLSLKRAEKLKLIEEERLMKKKKKCSLIPSPLL